MSLNKKNSNFIIHFIGIGGIGMSGIAELMLDQGYIIQGSDLVFNTTMKRLKFSSRTIVKFSIHFLGGVQ